MPYVHGYSRESMVENHRIFVSDGMGDAQAWAAAYGTARKAWRRAHGSKPYPDYLRGGRVARRRRANRAGGRRRDRVVCRCRAYGFPHARGGGSCHA
jgi:hypothetical protein